MSEGTARPARWRIPVIAAAAAIVLGVGACEAMGWPFLAAPMQRWLAGALDRRISLSADRAAQASVRVRLLGAIRITAPYIEIGAPAWSDAPHLLIARDATLTLGYGDLWRASRGVPLSLTE